VQLTLARSVVESRYETFDTFLAESDDEGEGGEDGEQMDAPVLQIPLAPAG
jgi:hypothetical protein